MPVLDARGIQHQTHLSVETIEAPPSAVAQIIFSAADSVGADLVVLGANRKPVCNHADSHSHLHSTLVPNATQRAHQGNAWKSMCWEILLRRDN